jgi:hypothetical protein
MPVSPRTACLHRLSPLAAGTLPPEWGTLRQLIVISLSLNPLAGALPSNYSSMAALLSLLLNGCNLGGGLPPEWGSLSRLTKLDLGSNKLQGGFPEQWGGLSALERLNLGGWCMGRGWRIDCGQAPRMLGITRLLSAARSVRQQHTFEFSAVMHLSATNLPLARFSACLRACLQRTMT